MVTQQISLQQQWDKLKQTDNEPSEPVQIPHYYAMADGLAHAHIYAHLEAYDHPKYNLFEHDELTAEQQPWLFPLYEKDSYSDWYLQESMGNYWGVMLSSTLPLAQLGEHLQQHLIVQDEHSKRHLIRLYDPRVLQPFLEVLTEKQTTTFFTPIQHIWADDCGKAGHWRSYTYRDKQIHLTHKHILTKCSTEEETCSC